MDPIGPNPNIPFPDVVGSGTAVCFIEEGTTTERWVVIEDAFVPDSKLDEIAPDSLLAKNLDGKRVGESFIWLKASSWDMGEVESCVKYSANMCSAIRSA